MAIPPISFPVAPVTGAAPATAGAAPAAPAVGDAGFAGVLASSVDQLQDLHATSDTLATQAATGDLKDVHDYMIASTEAALATDMVVAVRNKAVEAFTEIMRMPV